MKKPALVLTVGIALAALADKDTTVTMTAARVKITYGGFSPLTDGGYKFRACGKTAQGDNSPAPTFQECVDCEPGAAGPGSTACLDAWKTANQLK